MGELSDRLIAELVDAVRAQLRKETADRLRDIYLIGDIEKDTAKSCIERLRELANENDRPITELPDEDPIFHTAYDLKEKYQVGNYRSRYSGKWYRSDGKVPYWRAIRDDHGRVVVAINFNNDLGDSWQLADNPEYPQKYSYMGIRLGLNYLIYTMTH